MIPNSVVPSGKRARAALACSVALWFAIGCNRRQPDPEPVKLMRPPPPAEQPPPPPAPPPPYQDPPAWQKPRPRPPEQDDLTRAILEQNTPEAQKPRDFSAELQRMLSGANTCLQPRPGENNAISVTVTAHVMPGGTVSRGEVSGLQDEERACLRARIEALQFGPPIDNAPLTVMASLQLTPKQAAAPKQDAPKVDGLGMTITQAPSGEGITPGIVPKEDPGVIPPATPGVVPPADPGVPIAADPGVIPAPDPPAEVIPIPPPVQQ